MKKCKADIFGRAIDEVGKLIDTTGKCTLYNGIDVLVFDSINEKLTWIEESPNPWSKEKYRAELYALHDELYKRIWSTDEFISEPYISHGELVSAAATPSSPCHAEASAICEWYWATFALIDAEVNSAQEGADAVAFFNSLPNFSYVH